MQPTSFPVLLRLEGRPCLVVGATPQAWHKALELRDAGARVTLVAPAPEPELTRAPAPGPAPRPDDPSADPASITVRTRPFRSRDLEGVFLVVVADPDPELQEWIRGLACSRRTLVSILGRPELGDLTPGTGSDPAPRLHRDPRSAAHLHLVRQVRQGARGGSPAGIDPDQRLQEGDVG